MELPKYQFRLLAFTFIYTQIIEEGILYMHATVSSRIKLATTAKTLENNNKTMIPCNKIFFGQAKQFQEQRQNIIDADFYSQLVKSLFNC